MPHEPHGNDGIPVAEMKEGEKAMAGWESCEGWEGHRGGRGSAAGLYRVLGSNTWKASAGKACV